MQGPSSDASAARAYPTTALKLPSPEGLQVEQRAGDSWLISDSSGKVTGLYSPSLAARVAMRIPGGSCHLTLPRRHHISLDSSVMSVTLSRFLAFLSFDFPHSQSGGNSSHALSRSAKYSCVSCALHKPRACHAHRLS